MVKLILSILVLSSFAKAATIAIIDSGTDYKHELYKNQIWTNPIDKDGNNTDEDGNGFVDDFYGWNFAEKNKEIIDYKYLGTFSNDVYRFFEVQGKVFLGTATDDEITWMKSKRDDQEFIKELMKFGNFVHGTHVSGISAMRSEGNNIMGIKLIPTEVKAPGGLVDEGGFLFTTPIQKMIVGAMLKKLASSQMSVLSDIGNYVSGHKAEVANGSFGTGPKQAAMIVDALYEALFKTKPSKADNDELSKTFLEAVLVEAKKMADAAPKTLFVFAAGNDANDNDVMPTSPASLKADNSIAVAATLYRDSIASFSSYGGTTVHVAAPGVVINSAVPGDKMMRVSGTSQASPYVAGVAGAIIDMNTSLTPKEVKKILMGTVDKKAFLAGKVASGGIVNQERALKAAELTLTVSLDEAIERSNNLVSDVVEEDFVRGRVIEGASEFALPLPSMFSL